MASTIFFRFISLFLFTDGHPFSKSGAGKVKWLEGE
jgi:hypothetical protein